MCLCVSVKVALMCGHRKQLEVATRASKRFLLPIAGVLFKVKEQLICNGHSSTCYTLIVLITIIQFMHACNFNIKVLPAAQRDFEPEQLCAPLLSLLCF